MAGPFETGGNYIGAIFGGGAGVVAGGTGGAVEGGLEGAGVGTLVAPGVGTVAGGAAGGTAGWIVGGRLGRWADDKLGYGDQSRCGGNCSEAVYPENPKNRLRNSINAGMDQVKTKMMDPSGTRTYQVTVEINGRGGQMKKVMIVVIRLKAYGQTRES